MTPTCSLCKPNVRAAFFFGVLLGGLIVSFIYGWVA